MKVTTRKGRAYLKPNGDLTIARAKDFRDALVTSLAKANEIELNLVDVTNIDLACLQLMCAAHLSATKEGKSLTIKDPALPVFTEARELAGFNYSKPCRHVSTNDCLWISGGNE